MLMYGALVDVGRDQEQGARRGIAFTGASELKTGCKAAYGNAPVASRDTKPMEFPSEAQLRRTEHKMPPSQRPTRINLQEIKSEIVKRVGPEKANQYFGHFKRFIGCKLKKSELDKLVVATIGKKNVGLHNQLIRAVLSNAILGEAPPALPSFAQDISKPVKGIRRKPVVQSVSSNGETVLQNPETPAVSAGYRIRVNAEKLNLSGSNVNGALLTLQGMTQDEDLGAKSANFWSPDLRRLSQECQSAEEPDPDLNNSSMPSIKRLRSLPYSEGTAIESQADAELYAGECMEARDERYGKLLLHKGRSLSAPLGLPFCPGSFGSSQRPPFIGLPAPLTQMLLIRKEEDFLNETVLPDVDIIKKRMDHIATFDKLDGVSTEGAEVVSQALDIFLKRLIKSTINLKHVKSPQECIQFTGEDTSLSSQNEGSKDACSPFIKLHQGLNGVLINNSYQASGVQINQKERQNQCTTVTLQDFKVAMELNPRQLGEDWPLQLEKISFELFDQ